MEQEGDDAVVEQTTVTASRGSHDCRVLFVPNENGDTQPFIMNKRITAENAAAWVTHDAYRWWIETEYRAIKLKFLTRTSSTDHILRFSYFVFSIPRSSGASLTSSSEPRHPSFSVKGMNNDSTYKRR